MRKTRTSLGIMAAIAGMATIGGQIQESYPITNPYKGSGMVMNYKYGGGSPIYFPTKSQTIKAKRRAAQKKR